MSSVIITENHFAYLDELRLSGETKSMFGAAPYIEKRFKVSRSDARIILSAWINTFDPNKPPAERLKGL